MDEEEVDGSIDFVFARGFHGFSLPKLGMHRYKWNGLRIGII